jgi:hypothetical protein
MRFYRRDHADPSPSADHQSEDPVFPIEELRPIVAEFRSVTATLVALTQVTEAERQERRASGG